MSTDTIRRAAARLRERATAASPYWDLDVTGAFNGAFDTTQKYLDTVSPAVGLALADWLDTAGADLWAHGPLHCAEGCHDCDDDLWMPHARRALTLARLILGEA